jgi:hypothetical protein
MDATRPFEALGASILIEFRDEKTEREMLAWESFAEVHGLMRQLLVALVLPRHFQWMLILSSGPKSGVRYMG